MSRVEFDSREFRMNHPEFTEERISDEILEMLFEQAEYFVGNEDGKTLFPKERIRRMMLYLVTCHLATLHLFPEGQTGRIASASEGSVSTSFDLIKTKSQHGDWWVQTKCGAQYWQMTSHLRLGGRFYGHKTYHPWG